MHGKLAGVATLGAATSLRSACPAACPAVILKVAADSFSVPVLVLVLVLVSLPLPRPSEVGRR